MLCNTLSVTGAHTATLQEERQDVATDEDFGKPRLPNNAMRLAVDKRNDSAELHIYGCCEERRCHQKQERLNDIRGERPVRRFLARGKTCDVTDNLNCGKISGIRDVEPILFPKLQEKKRIV